MITKFSSLTIIINPNVFHHPLNKAKFQKWESEGMQEKEWATETYLLKNIYKFLRLQEIKARHAYALLYVKTKPIVCVN